jgi:hypothetical protein
MPVSVDNQNFLCSHRKTSLSEYPEKRGVLYSVRMKFFLQKQKKPTKQMAVCQMPGGLHS